MRVVAGAVDRNVLDRDKPQSRVAAIFLGPHQGEPGDRAHPLDVLRLVPFVSEVFDLGTPTKENGLTLASPPWR